MTEKVDYIKKCLLDLANKHFLFVLLYFLTELVIVEFLVLSALFKELVVGSALNDVSLPQDRGRGTARGSPKRA